MIPGFRHLATRHDIDSAVCRIIAAIEASGVSADDMALLNATLARAKALSSRIKKVARAISELDDSTPLR